MPRDLPVPGRELDGVHFAMEYLEQRNRWVARELGPEVEGARPAPVNVITAAGKHVIVIGGGDTGADCVGNAHRQGAASVTQIELIGEPPPRRPDDLTPWPTWPMKLRTSYALKEGGEREFAVLTTVLSGSNGRVERIHWTENTGAPPFDSSRAPSKSGRPTSSCSRWASSVLIRGSSRRSGSSPMRGETRTRRCTRRARTGSLPPRRPRGQSLIVWAIAEGRRCAAAVDRWLGVRQPGGRRK